LVKGKEERAPKKKKKKVKEALGEAGSDWSKEKKQETPRTVERDVKRKKISEKSSNVCGGECRKHWAKVLECKMAYNRRELEGASGGKNKRGTKKKRKENG